MLEAEMQRFFARGGVPPFRLPKSRAFALLFMGRYVKICPESIKKRALACIEPAPES
ncbi:MAG: hypothetical protein U0J65_12195 [Christensenellales bacterium]|nr:hypothetical protein [Christensenellales bacterium]